MGKIAISARVEVSEFLDLSSRVSRMKPKRTVSERIRQLIIADIKRGRKKEVK